MSCEKSGKGWRNFFFSKQRNSAFVFFRFGFGLTRISRFFVAESFLDSVCVVWYLDCLGFSLSIFGNDVGSRSTLEALQYMLC